MKTSELTGAALDWAAAVCQGIIVDGKYSPSTTWADCRPIIENARVVCRYIDPTTSEAECRIGDRVTKQYGPPNKMLETATRCYVISRLGDNIYPPEGL